MTKNALNMNDTWTVGMKMAALLLVAMTAGVLTLGAKSYLSALRETAACESAINLDQKLADLQETGYLLRRIHAGDSIEVRQLLATRLRSQLRDARAALPSVDAGMREFGERICNRILSGYRQHPAYYIVSSKSTGSVDSGTADGSTNPPGINPSQNN